MRPPWEKLENLSILKINAKPTAISAYTEPREILTDGVQPLVPRPSSRSYTFNGFYRSRRPPFGPCVLKATGK